MKIGTRILRGDMDKFEFKSKDGKWWSWGGPSLYWPGGWRLFCHGSNVNAGRGSLHLTREEAVQAGRDFVLRNEEIDRRRKLYDAAETLNDWLELAKANEVKPAYIAFKFNLSIQEVNWLIES